MVQIRPHFRPWRSLCSSAWCAQVTVVRSEEHTSELQSRFDLVCRLLLEKKKKITTPHPVFFIYSMLPPPPTSTLFPYTTLFRSAVDVAAEGEMRMHVLIGLDAGEAEPEQDGADQAPLQALAVVVQQRMVRPGDGREIGRAHV